jgi:GT2 family glycosyltransferase
VSPSLIPAVTVVIPLYNKAAYIQRTLTSLVKQTYLPHTIVVVNDGSTDDSAAQVEAFIQAQCDRQADFQALNSSSIKGAQPIIQLVHQANAGPGAARNTGLDLATTPYVAFLDADDEWLPTFLEHSVRQLQAHPDCVLSVTGQFRGAARTDWQPQLDQAQIEPGVWRLSAEPPMAWQKTDLDFLHSGAMVCDRTVLLEFGGFYSHDHCTYGEDIYLWLQVILHYPIYRDPQPLVWYHSEASDLSVFRRHCPPWPMLQDPHPIRQGCPPAYRPVLENILTSYAQIAAYRAATQGDFQTIVQLLQQFPLVRPSLILYMHLGLALCKSRLVAMKIYLKLSRRNLSIT